MAKTNRHDIDAWVLEDEKKPLNLRRTKETIDLTNCIELMVEYNGYFQYFRNIDSVLEAYFVVIDFQRVSFVLVFAHPTYAKYEEIFNVALLRSLVAFDADAVMTDLLSAKDGVL